MFVLYRIALLPALLITAQSTSYAAATASSPTSVQSTEQTASAAGTEVNIGAVAAAPPSAVDPLSPTEPASVVATTKVTTAAGGVDPTTSRPPVVFWASDPIGPDETALLFGDSLATTTAYGTRVPDRHVSTPPLQGYIPTEWAGAPLRILQLSNECAKVLLPADWKPGLYRLQLRGNAMQTDNVWLNRAEPWWWLADAGHTAHSGGDLRVFGKNFGPHSRVWLSRGNEAFELKVTKPEKYALACTIPANIPNGSYSLWVHNGFGGEDGFGKPLGVTIQSVTPWPTKTFNVEDYNGIGDSTTDSSDAIQAALNAAKANGGGIVYIPAGVYKITHKLTIPARTIVRGAGRDVTWLKVPHLTAEFDAVLAGNADFAIEQLAIVAQTTRRLIACPDISSSYEMPWGAASAAQLGHNVRLLELRLQHLRYGHRLDDEHADPRRKESRGPTTVFLAGSDMRVDDCDIVSSGIPLKLMYATRCNITGSQLGTGRNGWYDFEDMEESVFERNTVEGRDLEGSYGASEGKASQCYFAQNQFGDGYGDEREALTFDVPYSPTWFGHVTMLGARTMRLTGAAKHWGHNELQGQQILIVEGQGLGERMRVIGNDDNIITLSDTPSVQPTNQSIAACVVDKSNVIVTKNTIRDASVAIQLYSMACNFVVDDNISYRTGGIYGVGWDINTAFSHRFSPCWFNEFINNKLRDAFCYDQYWPYGILGVCLNVGPVDTPGVPIIGNIIRNNVADNGTRVGILGANKRKTGVNPARDTIIEGNYITDAQPAIAIAPGANATVIRSNRIHHSSVPLEDSGSDTWLDSREMLQDEVNAVDFALFSQPAPGSRSSLPTQDDLRAWLETALREHPPKNAADVARVDEMLETLFGLKFRVTANGLLSHKLTEVQNVSFRGELLPDAEPVTINVKPSSEAKNTQPSLRFRVLKAGDEFEDTLAINSGEPVEIRIAIRVRNREYEFDRPVLTEKSGTLRD